MNFKEAMQHVIGGGEVLRTKWRHHEEFFRIYVSANKKSINIPQSDFDYLKNKLVLSYLNEESEQVQPILLTVVREYSTNSFLYVFNEQDANAQDWEVLGGIDMTQAMIDFVFIAPPEDNQKFLGYVERVKHAQNCTEPYKIRFDYSTFYVHIHVLKTADKRNLIGVYAESDTKIIIRNKKTNDEFVTVIRFEELCFYDSFDLLVNKNLEFIKKHPVKHSEDFYTGLKNDN